MTTDDATWRPGEDLPDEVPVLIIGGSLVGLATANFLTQHGVTPLVVERHDGTAIHPRAGHFHLRTLELLRSVGLEAAVREESERAYFPDGGINEVHTLAEGETLSFITDLNQGVDKLSPSRRLFIAQQALEPMMRRHAEDRGAVLRYAAQATILSQDDSGVLVAVQDRKTGAERTFRARYVVAADGARSPVRRQLGIAMEGHGLLSRSATIYFRADCRELLEGSNQGVIYVKNARVRGFFRFERAGTGGFLAVNTLGDPREPAALDVVGDGLDDAGAEELVRAAIGLPDQRIEVTGVMPWLAEADVAERYREGRVFLAGDAAHVVPPNGGFGGNTGVQDAHNLAWKLAMVVKGEADEGLLDTYDAERRPVGRLTVDQAHSRYRRRTTPEIMGDDVAELAGEDGMELGYVYRSAAVVLEDEVAAPPSAGLVFPGEGRPGTRAPHVPVEHTGRTISTLDLYGESFVLLCGPDGEQWASAAREVDAELGVEVRAFVVGRDLVDPGGQLLPAHSLSAGGAVLVRPDGFVGWRSVGGGRHHEELSAALRRLLSRTTVSSEDAVTVG